MDNNKVAGAIKIFGVVIGLIAVGSFIWLIVSGSASKPLGPGEDKHWAQPAGQAK